MRESKSRWSGRPPAEFPVGESVRAESNAYPGPAASAGYSIESILYSPLVFHDDWSMRYLWKLD
jgi:hypothetical protein